MDEKKYILSGILTKFDSMNRNNGRIYDDGVFASTMRSFLRKSKIQKILKLI